MKRLLNTKISDLTVIQIISAIIGFYLGKMIYYFLYLVYLTYF